MLKKSIPNLLTFANLSFGVLSILEIIKQNYIASAAYIMIAVFIDRYDGRIAKRLNVCSEFGKELDSLADLVSFGVAPALLIFYKFNFVDLGIPKWVGVCFLLLYIISGSYRLANYNIRKFEGSFLGVPITVAGFVLSTYSLVAPSNRISTLGSFILLLVLSLLMVSKFNFKKI
ncbi:MULTISPECIES: CDP-diacylglycerol--serine O-phosphatidyltransferase [Paenibacillus]|uniref:CDP-diacylglycerol--serine O-phosphatidyltransferase n=1 Tax=Paenibacillus lautus TaxID=1401 RepID=A0A1R1ANU0_PAELA|nr:CDP-diacylglycerol--serine O-phosphatidyltransferase [Paenibacillus lautus]OME87078.1 CDP-diacylglycerol--serine O-phosphatidyltransferase [Paenibacillus lautus]